MPEHIDNKVKHISVAELASKEIIVHEMGIAMQVVNIALSSLPADMKDSRVEKVNLRIGKLSAVVPESLRFCFDIVVRDTPLADARLDIEEIPVVIRCRDCGKTWTITEPAFVCNDCESGSVEIISGQELEISSIEVADD